MSMLDRIMTFFGAPPAVNHAKAIASADRAIRSVKHLDLMENDRLVRAIREFGEAFPDRHE